MAYLQMKTPCLSTLTLDLGRTPAKTHEVSTTRRPRKLTSVVSWNGIRDLGSKAILSLGVSTAITLGFSVVVAGK